TGRRPLNQAGSQRAGTGTGAALMRRPRTGHTRTEDCPQATKRCMTRSLWPARGWWARRPWLQQDPLGLHGVPGRVGCAAQAYRSAHRAVDVEPTQIVSAGPGRTAAMIDDDLAGADRGELPDKVDRVRLLV